MNRTKEGKKAGNCIQKGSWSRMGFRWSLSAALHSTCFLPKSFFLVGGEWFRKILKIPMDPWTHWRSKPYGSFGLNLTRSSEFGSTIHQNP